MTANFRQNLICPQDSHIPEFSSPVGLHKQCTYGAVY